MSGITALDARITRLEEKTKLNRNLLIGLYGAVFLTKLLG